MRVTFLALAFWLLSAGLAGAQNIGDRLPDTKGLFVKYDGKDSLNVRLADHRFQVFFIDEQGLIKASPFKRMIIRTDPSDRKDAVNLVLRAQDGVPFLAHSRFIKPPYAFKMFIVLYPDAEGDAGRIVVPCQMFRWDRGK